MGPLEIVLIIVGALVLAAVMFLLLGPARMITRLFTSLTVALNGRVRALLAKEALAI